MAESGGEYGGIRTVFVSAPENHTMSLYDYDLRPCEVEVLTILRIGRSTTSFF